MAVIVQMSVSLVLFICVLVFVAACSSGVVLCCVRRADLGVPLIASGVIAFVVAGAQVEIDNNRNLQADRQSLELAFAQTRDLTSGDFRGRDLHQFYIAEKHLEYALFDGSDLARAAFRCDSLQVADFASPGDPSAVLTGATFTGDDLGSADFDHTNLQDAHFALLVGTAIANTQRQTDFSGANLSDSVMFNADLSGIDAQKADLDGTTLYDVNLSSADLGRASLRGATIGGAAYPRSSLKPEGTGLGPVDLRGANLANARLEGADLRGAYLFGAQLSGATADKHTKLPPGFELSRDGHHVIEQPGYVPGLLAPVPVPESPCPPDSRPQRFG